MNLAAMFLLKTLEQRRVTQTALNGIVKDIQGLWKDNMEVLKVFITILKFYYI